MKQVLATAVLLAALAGSAAVFAQDAKPAGGTTLGTVTLSKRVLVDGKPLAAGTYQIRLTGEEPKAPAGQSPEGARYVEFLRGGQVVGREVATVVSNSDMATIAKGAKPATNGSRVETLKGADYLRVWINRNGNNYLIHLPPAA
jgi:hypothetical protein